MAQDGRIKTPEGWEKEIRAVEKRIGDPKKWSQENYQELQDKLNEYKAWRENTPEGRAVVDYHNEPGEYEVPLPSHLKNNKQKSKETPVSANIEDNDSWLENIAEIFDPTGISSWDDVYIAYKNKGLSGETATEALGALPLLGKAGKLSKPGIHIAKYAGLDKLLFNKLPKNKYISNAFNTAGYTGRISDAEQAVFGSKDNSGFTWDMRHGEVPKFGGRNIFPQIQLGEHGDYAYGGDPSLSNIEGHYKTGGWLDQYQIKGEVKPVIYTDKALFNKAYKAEMDSANAYNSDKKWERFLKNTPDNVYTYDQLYNLYETQRKKGTAGWKLHVKTPTGSPKVDLERYIYTTDGKYLAGYSPVYKKPVVHNVYQEPEVITPDYLPMIQTGMPDMISREPEIIASPTPRPSSTNNRISWRMDPETRKMVPVYLEGKTQKVKEGKRLYNKNIPSSTAAIPADFVPQFEPDGNKDVVSKKMGGWLDAYDDEYRRGGQRRRRGTSKNIKSSINDLFRRNYDVFGPAGRNMYDPTAYKTGGWLDNID